MAAALLPVSCSQDECPALSQGTVDKIVLTRSAAGEPASLIDGGYETLTVYAYKGTAEDNHTVLNYENGAWVQSGALLVPVRDANFIGVTGTGTPFLFTLPDDAKDQSRDEGRYAADFMTTDRTALGEDNSLSLDFKHRMVQVTVKITDYGTELNGNTTVSDVTFKSYNAISLDYSSEKGEASVQSISLSFVNITPYGSQTEGYTAIIAPKAADELLMSLTANGKTFTVNTNTALESGNHYTFTLKVGKDLVKLASVSITSWEDPVSEPGYTTNVALPEAAGDGVGIFVHYGDNDPDNGDNLKLSGNSMIEHVWKGMDEKPHIVIYSPYDANAKYNNIPLKHGTDHCFASINADRSQTVSSLIGDNKTLKINNYRHIMGKLTLNFQYGSGGEIEPTNVKLNNFFETASLDGGAIKYPSVRKAEMGIDNWNGILVLPQTFLKDAPMVICTYNDKTYTYYPSEDITIESGKSYTLTLTIPAGSNTTSAQARSAGVAPQRMKGTITVEKN